MLYIISTKIHLDEDTVIDKKKKNPKSELYMPNIQ